MKTCPCCGSIEVQTHCKKVHGQPIEIKGMRYWHVECLDCGMRTRNCFDSDAKFIGFKNGKEEAISLWNTRKENESAVEANTKQPEVCKDCGLKIVDCLCP